MTYGDADVGDTAVAFGKALHVLAQLDDHANGFMTRDKLQRALAYISPEEMRRAYWEGGDELSFVNVAVSSTDTAACNCSDSE